MQYFIFAAKLTGCISVLTAAGIQWQPPRHPMHLPRHQQLVPLVPPNRQTAEHLQSEKYNGK